MSMFDWDNWLIIFVVWNKAVPYIWDVEFYDTGMNEVLIHAS